MPPTDPRFLAMTPEQLEVEYWAIVYAKEGVHDEIESESFEDDFAKLAALDDMPDDEFEEVINDQRS